MYDDDTEEDGSKHAFLEGEGYDSCAQESISTKREVSPGI
jgi:hypothetical protein